MNRLATDVAPYPLACTFDEADATEHRVSISNLLNPVPESKIAMSVLHTGNSRTCKSYSVDDNTDLKKGRNFDNDRYNSDLVLAESPKDSEEPTEVSSSQATKLESNEGEGKKGKKRTIAFGDTTVGCKVGKDSHVTSAGSAFRRLGKMKETRGRSTLYARLQNQRYESGELHAKSANLDAFRAKVTNLDTKAIVVDPKTVRHSKCGKSLKMQTPYHLANFKSHVTKCNGPPKSSKTPGGGMMHINQAFNQQQLTQQGLSLRGTTCARSRGPPVPCPGLRNSDNAKIEVYLERTGARGGGGSSVSAISQDLYGKPFYKLSQKRKNQVLLTQMHEWKWRNDHTNEAIFSTQCAKEAIIPEPLSKLKNSTTPVQKPQPCGQCKSLLRFKNFKNALNVSQPSDENYKYLNKRYRNENLAALYGRCTGLREIFEVSYALLGQRQKVLNG